MSCSPQRLSGAPGSARAAGAGHGGRSAAVCTRFNLRRNAAGGGDEPGRQTKRPAGSRPFFRLMRILSVSRGYRATPAEAVVDANLDGMFVIPEPGTQNRGRSAGEGGAAEIVILVFGLGRPARREHVFETGTDRVAIIVASVGGKGRRHPGDGYTEIVVVAPGVTALGIQQRRTPGVNAAAGDRAQLVVFRSPQGINRE